MNQLLFISDLHLSEERPQTRRLFLHFLKNRAIEADELFILGDLFDSWVGDDFSSDWTEEIIQGLKSLSDNGVDIYLMHGNRDFLLGENFCRETGAQLLPDPYLLKYEGKNILLMHGDLLCTDDVQYQKVREMRSTQQWMDDFLAQPLAVRLAMAEAYRAQSGESKSMLADDIMDANGDTVIEYMEKYDADMLIHGHTHRPAEHKHQLGERSISRHVLAEWHDDTASALVMTPQGISMEIIQL